jgi:hypothetical protein
MSLDNVLKGIEGEHKLKHVDTVDKSTPSIDRK